MYVSVECSAGTYYDATSKTCKYCPVGEYQTTPGQVQYTACAAGMTTETYGSLTVDECYGENLTTSSLLQKIDSTVITKTSQLVHLEYLADAT